MMTASGGWPPLEHADFVLMRWFIASCYTFPFGRRLQDLSTRQFVEVRYPHHVRSCPGNSARGSAEPAL